MGMTVSRLTILFEDPFWIGLYEHEQDGKYEVCKIVFGAEPKDYEILDFMLKNCDNLTFSPSIKAQILTEKHSNPKRAQRDIKRQLLTMGVSTKAQQALQNQREQNKIQRQSHSREQREAEKERQFELRQEKRKEKHNGH